MSKTKELPVSKVLPAVAFFYANAGYSHDPKKETEEEGRWRGARALAKAEAKASVLGFTFEWMQDDQPCMGCDCGSPDCACASGAPHETLVCVAHDGQDKRVASLCGICSPSREYKRVIEAELAMEGLA